MTFDPCGTSSKTNLADYLRCENRKRIHRGNVLPPSIYSYVCLTIPCCECKVSPSYHFVTTVSPIFALLTDLNLVNFIIHTPSAILLCLYALTWTDIVSREPWPMTTSRLPDDHAPRTEHLPPLRVLHHSSVHLAGHLRLLHPIDRSSYNWI